MRVIGVAFLLTIATSLATAVISHGYILSRVPETGGWSWLIAWIAAGILGYVVAVVVWSVLVGVILTVVGS